MSWDAYEAFAALLHAPMLMPVAMAPSVLWVHWAWGRYQHERLACAGLAISAAWALILAYLWRPGWGVTTAWGFWAPLVTLGAGRVGLGLGVGALALGLWRFRRDPSRRAHLYLQLGWAALWYCTLVLGGH